MRKYKLYILLSDTQSIISKGIKLYTRRPYSHVSIALDENLNDLYSFGRLKPHNPLIGGFVHEDIDHGTFNMYPNTQCILYSLDVSLSQYLKVKTEIEKFKYSYDKYGYNFLGLAGLIINRPINREYNYFCSQFVAKILNNSGISIIDKDIGLTLPEDFLNHQKLKLVYQGNLHHYHRNQPSI